MVIHLSVDDLDDLIWGSYFSIIHNGWQPVMRINVFLLMTGFFILFNLVRGKMSSFSLCFSWWTQLQFFKILHSRNVHWHLHSGLLMQMWWWFCQFWFGKCICIHSLKQTHTRTHTSIYWLSRGFKMGVSE